MTFKKEKKNLGKLNNFNICYLYIQSANSVSNLAVKALQELPYIYKAYK